MDRKILFLGGFYPDELYNDIVTDSKRGLQFAANNLQWSIIRGLEENLKDFTILTAPFISTFPFGYKKEIFKGCCLSSATFKGKCISFVNVPFFDNKKSRLRKELSEWYNNTQGQKCVIIYSLNSILMSAAIELKKNYPDLILCQIIPDLPEFMNANKVYTFLGLKKRDNKWIQENLENMDSYVLLTSAMVDYLDIYNKPSIVVEGIYNSSINIVTNELNNNNDKIILYTGALSEKYGIVKLLDAFSSISHAGYKLWICGGGDCEEEIRERSRRDERIKYWGLLTVSEILIMQRKATVLINPRPPVGEYVKYSFPSKTMEYFASETPVIMYRLEGVPIEYYKFCFVPINDTIQELTNLIQKICSMSDFERKSFGAAAREFILKQKNHIIQTRKILELVNKL